MLPDERREYIVELVTGRDGCRISELDVSETTIRRDLNELADRNSVERTHGGAIPAVGRLSPYDQRTIQNRKAKKTIAMRAVDEIHEEQIVLFDAGSTTLLVTVRWLKVPGLLWSRTTPPSRFNSPAAKPMSGSQAVGICWIIISSSADSLTRRSKE